MTKDFYYSFTFSVAIALTFQNIYLRGVEIESTNGIGPSVPGDCGNQRPQKPQGLAKHSGTEKQYRTLTTTLATSCPTASAHLEGIWAY